LACLCAEHTLSRLIRRKTATVAALEVLGGVAPAARHALCDLDVLAVLVLTLEAEVNPAVVTAVGPLLGEGGNPRVVLPYNWVAGRWSLVLLWSQAPDFCFGRRRGLRFTCLYDIIRYSSAKLI
jgi:hypothetical protein